MENYGIYVLKDSYFEKFKYIKNLSQNKNGRPQFLYIKDSKYDFIFWVIPLTTKIEKAKLLIEKESKIRKDCIKAHIIKIGKDERALLIQDMIPVTYDYIDHPYTINNIHLILKNKNEIKAIKKKANKWLALVKQGRKLFNTQIDSLEIYNRLIEENITIKEVAITKIK